MLPYLLCTYPSPETVPGTPEDKADKVLNPVITSPNSSKYIFLELAIGATSL